MKTTLKLTLEQSKNILFISKWYQFPVSTSNSGPPVGRLGGRPSSILNSLGGTSPTSPASRGEGTEAWSLGFPAQDCSLLSVRAFPQLSEPQPAPCVTTDHTGVVLPPGAREHCNGCGSLSSQQQAIRLCRNTVGCALWK